MDTTASTSPFARARENGRRAAFRAGIRATAHPTARNWRDFEEFMEREATFDERVAFEMGWEQGRAEAAGVA